MHKKWWPLAAVSLGNVLLLVDVTIVVSALPRMADGLGASFSALQWVMDGYALAMAALLMAAGSAADRFGRRRLYLAGLALFALASLACGLAPGAGTLIAARAAQGVGAAAMLATNTPLLMAAYRGRDRGIAFGIWGGTSGAATAIGPVLGGLLTEHLNWRAIFLVNLPLTAVAGYLTVRHLRESHGDRGTRIDVPGALAFTLSASALTYGLMRGGERGWAENGTLTWLAVAAVALVVFVLVERRMPQPLLDLRLLRRPSFAALMAAALLLQAAAFPYLTFVGLWVQNVLGLTPVQAGLAALPMALMSLLVGVLGGRALQRLAPQLPLGIGLLLIGAGALLDSALLGADAGWATMIPGLAVSGVGVGAAMPVLAPAALGAAPPQRAGMASGAVNTFRQLGFALGIAALGTLFTHALHGLTPGAPLPAVRAAYATGLTRLTLTSGLVAVAAGLMVLMVVRGTGSTGPVAAGGRARSRLRGRPRHRQAPSPTTHVRANGPTDLP
ncbi:MFS transporter [Streptomyces gilvosporeus]|uniref:MFS transporter n=1 Tax=Streptomyces gilvosporeus TaxID=553510 RepID=A0A1V0TU55_9ACTN|nr:MFS transporter [Streptomyces gilvosporeus]ARF56466.1 MFS transporter [Streptomyces gilvosporeus]